MAESMKRRGIVYSFVVALGAALLLALPLGLRTPAQASGPPLGVVTREYEVLTIPEATAYAIYTNNTAIPHQVWYRISGGDALYRQRLRVYQENAGPRPIDQLPPESELWQELTSNSPGRWMPLPSEAGVFTYYFDGDNRTTASSPWRDAFGVRVKRTRFSNGNLYQIAFEDQETRDDNNDLQLEVALVQPA
jgi:predicted secreted protein